VLIHLLSGFILISFTKKILIFHSQDVRRRRKRIASESFLEKASVALEYWCLDQDHGVSKIHYWLAFVSFVEIYSPKPQVDSKQNRAQNHLGWSSVWVHQVFISLMAAFQIGLVNPPPGSKIQIRWFLGKSFWRGRITSYCMIIVFPIRTDWMATALIEPFFIFKTLARAWTANLRPPLTLSSCAK